MGDSVGQQRKIDGMELRPFRRDRWLRSLGRVILYPILILIGGVVFTLPLWFVTGVFGIPQAGLALQVGGVSLVQLTLTAVTILVVTYLARRFIDKKSLATLGFSSYPGWMKDLAFGVFLGFFLQLLIFLAEWVSGLLEVKAGSWAVWDVQTVLLAILAAFVGFILVGFYEELMVRGYVLQTLESGWGTIAAVILSSIIFGLLHLANPGASLMGTANLFVAGLFFAYGYLVTRALWLPIGLHFSWNFFEGPIFSFPVSGLRSIFLLQTSVKGPVFVTGGDFGPEAGLSGLIAVLIGFGLIYFWSRRKVGRGGAPAGIQE